MIIENQEKRQAGIVVLPGFSGSGKTTLSKICDDEHVVPYTTISTSRGGERSWCISFRGASQLSNQTRFWNCSSLYGVTKDESSSENRQFLILCIIGCDPRSTHTYSKIKVTCIYEYGDRVKVYPVILNLLMLLIGSIKSRGGARKNKSTDVWTSSTRTRTCINIQTCSVASFQRSSWLVVSRRQRWTFVLEFLDRAYPISKGKSESHSSFII